MSERYWIAEVPARAVKTMLIRASSRKEAEEKLRDRTGKYRDDIEGLNVHYQETGIGRIVGEDKKH
jgi:hypothetical protein